MSDLPPSPQKTESPKIDALPEGLERKIFITLWQWLAIIGAIVVVITGAAWALIYAAIVPQATEAARRAAEERIAILRSSIDDLEARLKLISDKSQDVLTTVSQNRGYVDRLAKEAEERSLDATSQIASLKTQIGAAQGLASALGDVKTFAVQVSQSTQLQDYISTNLISKRAVLPFVGDCPASWTPMHQAEGLYLRAMGANVGATGGQGTVVLRENQIPILQVRTTTNFAKEPLLWGASGPSGEGKLYSFLARDAGYSGVAAYPTSAFSAGNPTPQGIPIEPPYFGLILCQPEGS